MIEILDWSKRHVIYSLLISLIFLLLAFIVNKVPDTVFVAVSLTGYLILLVELFVTSNHYHIKKRKNSKTEYYFEHHHNLQYLHHIGYPSILYFSFTSILYFFHSPFLNILIVIGATILFSLIFVNIYSFYNHDLSLTISTKYIYDLIGVILIFVGSINIIELYNIEKINNIVFYILIAILFFYTSILAALRHVYSSKSLIISVIVSTLLFFITVTFVETALVNFVSIAFLSAYLFQNYNYLIVQMSSKKFNRESLFEYVIINVLILAIFYTATA